MCSYTTKDLPSTFSNTFLTKLQRECQRGKRKPFPLQEGTLVKSILFALLSYVMQSERLPRFVCDGIDDINRTFLWEDSMGERKLHTVKWDLIYRPKSHGGLGIRKMREVNNAFMLKLAWGLCVNSILRQKNKYGDGIIPKVFLDKFASNY